MNKIISTLFFTVFILLGGKSTAQVSLDLTKQYYFQTNDNRVFEAKDTYYDAEKTNFGGTVLSLETQGTDVKSLRRQRFTVTQDLDGNYQFTTNDGVNVLSFLDDYWGVLGGTSKFKIIADGSGSYQMQRASDNAFVTYFDANRLNVNAAATRVSFQPVPVTPVAITETLVTNLNETSTFSFLTQSGKYVAAVDEFWDPVEKTAYKATLLKQSDFDPLQAGRQKFSLVKQGDNSYAITTKDNQYRISFTDGYWAVLGGTDTYFITAVKVDGVIKEYKFSSKNTSGAVLCNTIGSGVGSLANNKIQYLPLTITENPSLDLSKEYYFQLNDNRVFEVKDTYYDEAKTNFSATLLSLESQGTDVRSLRRQRFTVTKDVDENYEFTTKDGVNVVSFENDYWGVIGSGASKFKIIGDGSGYYQMQRASDNSFVTYFDANRLSINAALTRVSFQIVPVTPVSITETPVTNLNETSAYSFLTLSGKYVTAADEFWDPVEKTSYKATLLKQSDFDPLLEGRQKFSLVKQGDDSYAITTKNNLFRLSLSDGYWAVLGGTDTYFITVVKVDGVIKEYKFSSKNTSGAVLCNTVGSGIGSLANYKIQYLPLTITENSFSGDYFRSKATGNWNELSAWESSSNNSNWISSTLVPTSSATAVSILNSHKITITTNATASSLTINTGGQLTLNSGNTLVTTALNINSDVNGTGTFVDKNTTGQVVTGTVQQYLGSARNWYITPPVAGATVPSGKTYYSYIEAGNNTGFVAPASLYWVAESQGAPLDPRKGYIVQATEESTLNFTGTLNTGSQTPLTLTRTAGKLSEGFNLVANPYPSYLDWTMVSAANSGLLTTAWFRTKNATGGYIFATVNVADPENPTIVAVNPNTTITTLIPPMQAYWVRVANVGNTSYTVNNSMRKHIDNGGNKFKAPKQNTQQIMRLQISNGSNTDEAVLLFNANATNGIDMFDSPKMFNNIESVPEIYTQVGMEKLVINGMKELKYDTKIPIGFSTLEANDFKISAKELSNFEAGTRVILLDKLNPNVETELTNETAYNFSAPITATTTDRFSLIFRTSGAITGVDKTEKTNTQVFVNSANQITIVATEKSNYSIYNAMGQKVNEGITTSNCNTVNCKLQTGMYVVQVANQSTRIVLK